MLSERRLDSCAVLGLAAKHRADPIRAFTLTFDRADYDEEKEAREMALKVGAEFFAIPIRQDDLADHFADAVLQSETFCFNAHGVAKYLLSRAVRNAGYKVVITGEGSDEILGGYAQFRRAMLLYNRDGQDPATVATLLEELNELNPVSLGLLLPHGEARPLEMSRGFSASFPLGSKASPHERQRCKICSAEISARSFVSATDITRFSVILISAPTCRTRSRATITLSVVKNVAPGLYLDRARRSHGNGAFDRRTSALPRSSGYRIGRNSTFLECRMQPADHAS